VVYYGITPTDDERLQGVRAAVMGHYAEQDYLVTACVLNTKRLLGERFTYHIYPTDRGFFGGSSGRGPGPPQRVAAAAKQAWARTVAFLQKGAR
jgi:dienelactone hydrolase